MKKIISALTVSALALGSLFAEVSLEYTQRGYVSSDNGHFKFAGYDDDTTNTSSAADPEDNSVVFTLSNDTAGAVVDIKPTVNKKIMLKHYYGWVNFAEGAFKLQSGIWEKRNVNEMKDDGFRWANNEYARYALGTQSGIGKDIADLIYIESDGAEKLSTALSYTNENFFATGAIVSSDYTDNKVKSGFAAEAGVKVGEGNKINVIVKNPKIRAFALGAFWENTTLKENLDLLAGVTFGREQNKNHEIGFDLRARYVFNETLALTTMHNLTYTGSKKQFALWDMASLAVSATDTIKITLTGEWEYSDLLHEKHTRNDGLGKLDFIPGVTYTPAEGVDLSSGIIIRTTGWPKAATTEYAIPFVLHVAL